MKMQKHIEWSIVEDEVLIVNPDTNKVLTGNKSVASVIGFCVEQESFDVMILAKTLQTQYCINEADFDDFYTDILYIVDYLKKEGILIEEV